MALLLSVTERYKFLPVANRLEFLRLQIDLIEVINRQGSKEDVCSRYRKDRMCIWQQVLFLEGQENRECYVFITDVGTSGIYLSLTLVLPNSNNIEINHVFSTFFNIDALICEGNNFEIACIYYIRPFLLLINEA